MTSRNSTPPSPIPIWHRFVAGTASGIALVLVGHPLDTLKVKMQLSSGSVPPSLGSVFQAILRTDGLSGFYRGFLPPLLFTGGVNTVLWGLQYTFTDALEGSGQGGGPTSRAMLSAIASGLLVSVLVTPIEGIKTRMQAVSASAAISTSGAVRGVHSSESTYAVFRRVMREGGFRRGLFRGWSATALARMSNWAYFGGNAAMTEALATQHETGWAKTRTSLLAGGTAGLCYWAVAFPWDTLKARMMLAHPPYPSLRAAALDVYQGSGMGGFWRGFVPCALRAFPANAAAFGGFSLAMDALHRRGH